MRQVDTILAIHQTRVINDSLESRMPRKCASPVRREAVGNLRQPVAPVGRHRESQQGAGRLPDLN
jgi:hypothetical protein